MNKSSLLVAIFILSFVSFSIYVNAFTIQDFANFWSQIFSNNQNNATIGGFNFFTWIQNVFSSPLSVDCGECIIPSDCGSGYICNMNHCCISSGGGGCTPKTCSQLGVQCGQTSNGCNSYINCGSCPTGYTCSGGVCQGNVCRLLGQSCSGGYPCCSGLVCSGGICQSSSPIGGGNPCQGKADNTQVGGSNPCYNPYRCCNEQCINTGNQPCSGTVGPNCHTENQYCSDVNPCCSGLICSGNICISQTQSGSCVYPLTNCNGQCKNTLNDPLNCGGCGNVCPGNGMCSGGQCTNYCVSGQTYCPGSGCSNLNYDNNNCGKCGNKCTINQICSSGTCAPVQGTSTCNSISPAEFCPSTCSGQCPCTCNGQSAPVYGGQQCCPSVASNCGGSVGAACCLPSYTCIGGLTCDKSTGKCVSGTNTNSCPYNCIVPTVQCPGTVYSQFTCDNGRICCQLSTASITSSATTQSSTSSSTSILPACSPDIHQDPLGYCLIQCLPTKNNYLYYDCNTKQWQCSSSSTNGNNPTYDCQKMQQGTVVGSAIGVITDSNGNAVSNAKITLTSSSGVSETIQTDSNGVYIIHNLPSGSYAITAVSQDYSSSTKTISVNGQTVPVQITLNKVFSTTSSPSAQGKTFTTSLNTPSSDILWIVTGSPLQNKIVVSDTPNQVTYDTVSQGNVNVLTFIFTPAFKVYRTQINVQ